MPASEVFLDTAYAIALSAMTDQHHLKAVEVAQDLKAQNARLITTRAIVVEIGNALAKVRYRQAAIALIQALENDPNIEIIPLTEAWYRQALHLYQTRPDKEWGITDCISFVVMKDRNLFMALTTDQHFQ